MFLLGLGHCPKKDPHNTFIVDYLFSLWSIFFYIYIFIQDGILLYPNLSVYVYETPSFFTPPHPISTYTYGVTIAPRMCDGNILLFNYCYYALYFSYFFLVELRYLILKFIMKNFHFLKEIIMIFKVYYIIIINITQIIDMHIQIHSHVDCVLIWTQIFTFKLTND